MNQERKKRILYHTFDVFRKDVYNGCQQFTLDDAEAICTYNWDMGVKFLSEGSYDLIGVHHSSASTYNFAEKARKLHPSALIVAVTGAISEKRKQVYMDGLRKNPNNPFDDVVVRNLFGENVEEITKKLASYLKSLDERIENARTD